MDYKKLLFNIKIQAKARKRRTLASWYGKETLRIASLALSSLSRVRPQRLLRTISKNKDVNTIGTLHKAMLFWKVLIRKIK